MSSASLGKKLSFYLGVSLVVAWFLTNAYLTYQENKVYSDELSASYGRFHTWSNSYMKKTFGISPLPGVEFVKAWKSKIALVLGYLYAILSFCLLLGQIKYTSYVLLFLHLLHSLIFDNPATTITQGAYEGKLRACLFDLVIAAVILMISGVR